MLASVPWVAGAQPDNAPNSPNWPNSPVPPACQNLTAIRNETRKAVTAINEASKRKAPVEACTLFQAFLAQETKLIKALDDSSAQCGVPSGMLEAMKASHVKAQQLAKHVCQVARDEAIGPKRPTKAPRNMPTGDHWMPGEFERLMHPR
jgi:hypothetical protein